MDWPGKEWRSRLRLAPWTAVPLHISTASVHRSWSVEKIWSLLLGAVQPDAAEDLPGRVSVEDNTAERRVVLADSATDSQVISAVVAGCTRHLRCGCDICACAVSTQWQLAACVDAFPILCAGAWPQEWITLPSSSEQPQTRHRTLKPQTSVYWSDCESRTGWTATTVEGCTPTSVSW